MASQDGFTAERILYLIDVGGNVVMFIFGLGLLYLGVYGPPETTILGINAFVWLGLGILSGAVYFWMTRGWLRRQLSE